MSCAGVLQLSVFVTGYVICHSVITAVIVQPSDVSEQTEVCSAALKHL